GLVVIDFIDMYASRNQREVENTLKEALKMDRARVQIGRISRFGLLEMSRQRLRPSLGESVQIVCPRCDGHGTIRSIESLALSILRIIEEDSMKEQTARIVVQVPVNVATFLLNEKRQMISEIESRQKIQVVLIPNSTFEVPHYEIQRERASDLGENADSQSSYSMATEREEASESISGDKPKLVSEVPAVQGVVPASPKPAQSAQSEKPQGSFIKRLFSSFVGGTEEEAPEKPAEEKPRRPAQRKGRGRGGRGSSNRRPARRNEGQRNSQNRNQKNDAPKDRAEKPVKAEAKSTEPQKTTDMDTTNKPASEQSDQSKEGQQSSGSRRGRRGGRRRRSSGNKQTSQGEGTQADSSVKTESTDTSAATPSAATKPVESSAPVSAAPTANDANKTKPSETKSGTQPQKETKPAGDARSSEVKTSPVAKAANKPVENKSVENKPVESKPVNNKTEVSTAPKADIQKPSEQPVAKPVESTRQEPKAAEAP
ncbi:MAG: ribonuclease E/G, partial [Gammaproteobacteria bacterium]|nr:ribonuclease E/G [Gammaproteobacteria bacterium]